MSTALAPGTDSTSTISIVDFWNQYNIVIILIVGSLVLWGLSKACNKNMIYGEGFRDYAFPYASYNGFGYPYRYNFGYTQSLWPWQPNAYPFYNGYIVP